jgi:alkylhydroperoxidase/carboxymuconolactone decarboxylase family protein YurZ
MNYKHAMMHLAGILLSNIDVSQLPSTLRKFIQRNPKIWELHEALGLACRKAGPLSDKEIEFIKMGITGSQMLETAFKTHVRKASEVGASADELQHVIVQLLPIAGMGRTMMAAKWLEEATEMRR